MKRISVMASLMVTVLLAAAPAGAAPQTCGPDPDGRVADTYYDRGGITWRMVVPHEKVVLTINGPCEEIVREFGQGEDPFFDLGEINRVLDGRYTWQLLVVPVIDSGVREGLQSARGSGKEDQIWWSYWTAGKIPDQPSVESANFSVVNGSIVDPKSGEEGGKRASLAARGSAASSAAFAAAGGGFAGDAAGAGGDGPTLSAKDFVINDDLIVDGSACIGFDCVNGEVFSFDTIRLKENNLRIKFDDTSTVPSFPANDWQLTANESANGGASKFSIEDISGGRTPFTVEANARSHSLYVDDGGRIGSRTSTPSVEIHTIDGDTPTLRLQQDGSSGFEPQTWDVAGNETNFFIRDVTNGSALPFRIRPGAPSNSIFIDVDGDVGMGTSAPVSSLDIKRNQPLFHFADIQSGAGWAMGIDANEQDYVISKDGTGGTEVRITQRDPTGATNVMDVDGDIEAVDFNMASSRDIKTGFMPLDTANVLARLTALPLMEWSYKTDPTGARHLGPVAEDFQATFGLSGDGKTISLIEANGIALAAIQGLHAELQAKTTTVTELESENRRLRDRQQEIERANRELESRQLETEARVAELSELVSKLAEKR